MRTFWLWLGMVAVGAGCKEEATSPNAAVASVEIIPFITLVLNVGDTYQLAAIPRDANGNALTGRTITWTTSAAAVAKVSSAGLVTAMAEGSAMITATVEGKSASVGVLVGRPPAGVL